MHARSWLFLGIIVGLSSGCATGRYVTGTPLRDDDVKQLVDGTTRVAQVTGIFGEPSKPPYPVEDALVYTWEYKVTRSQVNTINPWGSDTDVREEVDKLTCTFKAGVLLNHRLVRGVK